MVIVKVGDKDYIRYYISFHFKRENNYSPWQVIGLVVLGPYGYAARYHPDFEYLKKEWKKEWYSISEITIALSYDALDAWHRRHQEPTLVLSKVVTYYTPIGDHRFLTDYLYTRFVYNAGLSWVRLFTLMFNQRDAYFPGMLGGRVEHKAEILEAILEAKQDVGPAV